METAYLRKRYFVVCKWQNSSEAAHHSLAVHWKSACSCFPSIFLQNGLLSAIPYLVSFILSLLAGQVADFLRYRGILGTGKVRKLMTSTGKHSILRKFVWLTYRNMQLGVVIRERSLYAEAKS